MEQPIPMNQTLRHNNYHHHHCASVSSHNPCNDESNAEHVDVQTYPVICM